MEDTIESTEIDGEPIETDEGLENPYAEEEEYVAEYDEDGNEILPEPEEDKEVEEEKTYKMKIKGEEKEISASELKEFFGIKDTPLTDEVANVLVKSRQIHLAGQQAFTEASHAMKQLESFVGQLQSDPMSVLLDERLGINFPKLAEDYIIEQLQLEQMPEAERRARQLQKENEQLRKFQEQQLAEQQRAIYEQQTEAYTDHFAKDISSAIQSAGLPLTEFTMASASKYMRQMYQELGEVPPAKDVMGRVRQELASLAQTIGKTLPPEQLAEIFGEDGVKKIRQHEISKIKKPRQATPGSHNWKKDEPTRQMTPQGGNKPTSLEEFRQMLDQRVPLR
jgi:hypothetical protein